MSNAVANSDPQGLRARTRFTAADQLSFAQVSGDFNPMHIDAQYSRRLPYGDVVVHGIHTLLRALELFFGQQERAQALVSIASASVKFPSPVFMETAVEIEYTKQEKGPDFEVAINLRGGGRLAMTAELVFRPGNDEPAQDNPDWEIRSPQDLGPSDLENLKASIPVLWDRSEATRVFPHLTAAVRSFDLASLATTSRLVGMYCPGLHSIYSSLQLAESGDIADRPEMQFEVTRFDSRFQRARLSITTGTLSGEISTFLRPAPFEQPALTRLQSKIAPNEFAGHRALIVGGSRGLGELASKALAAGGAQIAVTFHTGKDDADRVVRELQAAGASAESFALDVREPDFDSYQPFDGAPPTVVLYMATPPIFVGGREQQSTSLRARFAAFYEDGLQALAGHYATMGTNYFLAPSSEAADTAPAGLVEYSESKIAMEAWAESFSAEALVRFDCPRWPRMESDQTMTNMPVETADSIATVVESLRKLLQGT